ncbi:hypothetical protein OPAG_08116 [Rhodococcus opacus PD630]|uniref:ATP-binding protein n=1 Tax=Rhodococcus opacus TaxID=37919 RepID=UPI00029CBB95|nr:DUF87 domain-containing protein [Rhodococcus opacus]EHI41296.1 hypothetical protein OPAG_08116 [Rhodococcus opacus PD630]UDH01622.1 DUF87 domain-containing protein [Rhodococcus opacus PD630]
MTTGVNTEMVDYLQRLTVNPRFDVSRTAAAPEDRRLLHVSGVGLSQRNPTASPPAGQRWRARTADLITGLYGYKIPFAFQILGTPGGVRLHLGTWSSKAGSSSTQDRRRDVLRAVLNGLYQTVTAGDESDARRWMLPQLDPNTALAGFATGTPDPVGVQPGDPTAPIDRIIASAAGTTWSVLVLAYPVAEPSVIKVRQEVLNEMRAVETAARAEGAPSPLAEHYIGLLKRSLADLGEGLAIGAWRTGVYLLGDEESYPPLAAGWRSVFSGALSLPEPVRVHAFPNATELAATWGLPDQRGEPGPGYYNRPFEMQTLLTTTQLAAYAHLPEVESPGFAIETVPQFGSAAPAIRTGGLPIGRILHRRRESVNEYRVPLRALTRHVFVAGVTGAGKTNTIFSLLSAADAVQVPFLVIEPTKKEYRALLAHPRLGPRARVFTAGNFSVAPLPLNPFEVPAGIPVSEHLDLIRSAFMVAFGLWTPLPQILERCLHEIYTDRGWDLRTNRNTRLRPGDAPSLAYPTLTELVTKVEEVVPTLGYESQVTGDLRAALITRLHGLRAGGKGAMLDVDHSIPNQGLFGQPTVVELESLADAGDKAFVAALIFIRLAEYRRVNGRRPGLEHLLVIEEAHRLLANTGRSSWDGAADPRGQAVETFSNLLSEIRAYGQGVIIADQVPVRLAPDVIKNTDLKIAHRLVASDDRASMAGAMAMDDEQARALATLDVGEAAVFSSGDDQPMLVRIPLVKDPLAPDETSDDAVRASTAKWREQKATSLLARTFCASTCAGSPESCAAARELAGDEYIQRSFGRMVLATIDEIGALDRLWPDLLTGINARRRSAIDAVALQRSLAGHLTDWYVQRRGAQEAWLYVVTADYSDRLRAVLLDKIESTDPQVTLQLRRGFQEFARQLAQRNFAPYPVCDSVCTQDPPLCLYRSAVADVVARRRYKASWQTADNLDAQATDGRRKETWEVCQDAAYEITEFPEEGTPEELNQSIITNAKRVCLCFEQQMLAQDTRKSPRTVRHILQRVIGEAGL